MGTQITPPSGGAPTPGVASAANAYMALFDAAYAASKPPALQPLYNGYEWGSTPNAVQLTQAQRWTLISQLISEGWTIDEEIDGLGFDPYSVMYMRQLYGDTWVPAGLGNVVTSAEMPSSYTGPVPAGAIKVSTLLSDYPPYPVPVVATPVVPPIPEAANPVGIRIFPQVPSQPNYVGDIFRCAVANDGYPVSATWTGASGAFTGTWTKQALELGMMIVWTKTA
ncbi:MAG: hypothetical protein ABSF12_10830 [Bryobacteraceae bacterium]|jgi:hypothetical protein